MLHSKEILSQRSQLQRHATKMLIFATVFWGVSFPIMKALGMVQQVLLPGGSSWFTASSTMVVRFGSAGIIMLIWSCRTIRQLTWLEFWQGFGLGVFSGAGMVLQMDGLTYTAASTSAFLTQSYCLLIPVLVAMRERRLPSLLILGCSAMVMVGVAVLARIGPTNLRMGRGEIETLISSLIFAGQILWLERPLFAPNRVSHFTCVMFVTMALVSLPVALVTMQRSRDWLTVYGSAQVQLLILALVLLCTMIAFVMMNRWQPVLPAPEAALIYAAEPVFASLFALFLPDWLSWAFNLSYANERATFHLLLGGGLITLANVLVQVRSLKAGGFK